MRVIWAVRAVAAVVCLAAAGCDRGDQPRNLGHMAPQFTVSDGVQTVDLAQLRGHVVLLNFWASYCAPCVEELPSLLQLQQQMPGLKIIAISIDPDEAAYRRFVVRHHVDLTTVRDQQGHINSMYGTAQIPETYVIDKNGVLRRKFVSAQDWTSPEIVGYLHKLGA